MREGQINSLEQSEVLLKSAEEDIYHKEIAKYLIHNINSIAFALEKGWCSRAGKDDIEYMHKYIHLRDTYAPLLYPESLIGDKGNKSVHGEYNPDFDDNLIFEALNHYDFNNECGEILFNCIKSRFSRRCNEWHIKNDTAENVAFALTIFEKIQLMKKE